MATNYYVIGNSAAVPNLTGTPYEGYKIVTEDQISSASNTSTNQMHAGDKVVISGSVDSDVTLQPSNGQSDGFDLKVEIQSNSHSFNVSTGNRTGGTVNNTEPNVTVEVTGKAADVSIGNGSHMETLKVNLADNTSIGNITGSTEADDQLTVTGGDGVRIGNITSKSGALKSDSVTLGDNAHVGNVTLGSGADTFQMGTGGTTGKIDTGAGSDHIKLGTNSFTTDIATGKGQDVVEIGTDSRTGNISGGDNTADTMHLTVGDGSTIGNVNAGTVYIGSQYGGNDTITLGNNVTAGTIATESGDDQITIGDHSKTGEIYSGDGNDTVTTGSGTNTGALSTGSGDDTITIGGETTNINVGSGATNLHVTATGSTGDLTFGGYDDKVVVDGKAGYIQGAAGSDTIIVNGTSGGIEGNTGDDFITVNGSSGAIYGGDGSDSIHLGDGATVGGSVDFGNGGSYGDTLTGGNNVLINGGVWQTASNHYSHTDLGDGTTITGNVDLHAGRDFFSVGKNSSIGGFIETGADGNLDDDDVLKLGAGSVVEGHINTYSGDDTVDVGANTTLKGGWNPINTYSGKDILILGDNVVIPKPSNGDARDILSSINNDTIIAHGGGDYVVDFGTGIPNGADMVKVVVKTQEERDALKESLAAQGFVDPDGDGVYTNPASYDSTFVWKGVTYKDLAQVMGIPCFTRGTLILTKRGDVAIEDLRVGDLVLTADNGYQPIRWIGGRVLSAETLAQNENLRPIRIRRGALGQNTPTADLIVSPQHRILVRSKIAQKMFGAAEVLVAAKQLAQLDGIDVATELDEVEYFHILFNQHEVIMSNGALTESLYTGVEALKSVGAAAREEIFAIFPELMEETYEPVAARQLSSGRMGRKLVVRHLQKHRPLVN